MDTCPFLTLEDVEGNEVLPLISDLDRGERETLFLYLESEADLVLIDDKMARKIAKQRGFCYTGTLGVLLRAKREGVISKVEPLIEHLTSNGFYVSREVRQGFLRCQEKDNKCRMVRAELTTLLLRQSLFR